MGLRNAGSYLIEISAHLVEDYVFTTLTGAVSAGLQTPTVGSTDAMYPGAQIVINDANPALIEVVTITAVSVPGSTFTATFAFAHNSNTQLLGGTFPTQQPTDPLFTQTEVLTYLARAQNEFLARIPCIFAFANQTVTVGQIYQPTPPNTIELERVALGNFVLTATLNVLTLALTNGTVTATISGVAASSPAPAANQQVYVIGTTNDAVFGGVQQLTSFLSTGPDTATVTWTSLSPDTTATSGNLILLTYSRLYETTQEQIACRDPNWLYNAAATGLAPQAWFEDRAGVYGWGLAPQPQSNFPVQLIYSTRGPTTLGLLDTLLVPDMLGYLIKYKTMEFIYRKDGEQRSPSAADYCMQRFERGVAIVDRYLRNVQQVGG